MIWPYMALTTMARRHKADFLNVSCGFCNMWSRTEGTVRVCKCVRGNLATASQRPIASS